MSSLPQRPSSPESAEAVEVAALKRRVVKQPPLPPLDPERRYVQPKTSNVAVLGGFLFRRRKFKVGKKAFGPDGLRAPTRKAREKFRFNEYFELGTGIKVSPDKAPWELNVFRNRIVFFIMLAVVIGYCLAWLAG